MSRAVKSRAPKSPRRIPLNASLVTLVTDAQQRVVDAIRVRDTIVQTILASQGITDVVSTSLEGATLVVALPVSVPSDESMR